MEPISFDLKVSSQISVAAFTVFLKRVTANILSHPKDKIGVKIFYILDALGDS